MVRRLLPLLACAFFLLEDRFRWATEDYLIWALLAVAAGIALVERAPKEERLMDDRPRYMISVAAELVGMHPQTLRIYEQKGLVQPKRTAGNTRLYSEVDLERLRLIQRLTTEIGLNLAGVERVLHLEDELQRMRRRLDRMEREMRDGDRRGAPPVPPRPRPLPPGGNPRPQDARAMTSEGQSGARHRHEPLAEGCQMCVAVVSEPRGCLLADWTCPVPGTVTEA